MSQPIKIQNWTCSITARQASSRFPIVKASLYTSQPVGLDHRPSWGRIQSWIAAHFNFHSHYLNPMCLPAAVSIPSIRFSHSSTTVSPQSGFPAVLCWPHTSNKSQQIKNSLSWNSVCITSNTYLNHKWWHGLWYSDDERVQMWCKCHILTGPVFSAWRNNLKK